MRYYRDTRYNAGVLLVSLPKSFMALTLIKNKKGRIVSCSPERKKFLLDTKPVALKANGQPKEDNNGNPIRIIKSQEEEGWSDVTPAEQKQFEAELAAEQDEAQEVQDAQRAAMLATETAASLTAKAGNVAQRNANAKGKPGRKSKAEKEAEESAAAKVKEEMEAKVREAQDDAEKYDALSDDEKAMYIELFEEAPQGSK